MNIKYCPPYSTTDTNSSFATDIDLSPDELNKSQKMYSEAFAAYVNEMFRVAGINPGDQLWTQKTRKTRGLN